MPEINLFNGGINRHKDSRKLESNEFISLLDGEVSSGSIVSLARPIFTQSDVSPVFVEYKDNIISGSGEYLKFARSLHYLFKCNGDKPQYTLGNKDSNGNIEWFPLGIDLVNSLVKVKKLTATMTITPTSNKGTSEIAVYHYAIVLDEGLATERVYMIDYDCTTSLKTIDVFPSSIDKPFITFAPYRKYGSEYYRLEDGSSNDVTDFVEGSATGVSYPEITDAQFTYISPKTAATGTRHTWYGTLFRTNGNGIGRLWAISSSSNYRSSYEWSNTNVAHYIDDFNFKSGSSPAKGTEFIIRGLINNYLSMSIIFMGKELINGNYTFIFDVYHIYGNPISKLFMYRIKFGFNFQEVTHLEDIEAAKVNPDIVPSFRKVEPTVYRDARYQEFTKTLSGTGGLRSSSASMHFDQPLTATGLTGDFQYALTYVDDAGQETAAGEYSSTIGTDGASLEVTIPLPVGLAETVTKIRLYRMDTSIYGGQTSFLFVKEFNKTELPVVYIDNAQVSDLGGHMPSATVTPVAEDLLFLTAYTGRLFAATKDYYFSDVLYTPIDVNSAYPPEPHSYGTVWTSTRNYTFTTGNLIGQSIVRGSQLLYTDNSWEIFNDGSKRYNDYLTIRWSDVGKPLVWQGNSWLNMDAPITGIGTSSNGLLIFSLTETFALLGTESEPFTRRLISSSQGCVDFRSLQTWNGNCIFASVEGICMSNGGTVDLISYPKMGIYNMLNDGGSSYTSVTDSLIAGSSLVGNTYFLLFKSRGILKLDLITGVFTEMTSDLLGLGLYNGSLHGVDTSRNLNVIPYQVGGTKSYSVTTGKLTESAISNLKEYDKVRINISGTATISVTIDDKVVIANKHLKDGVTIVGIPNEANKGYSIQFNVGGTGSLHNIEYSIRGRENG